jgi:predicted lipid-binding transport protein (Tim44 family)
MNTSPASNPFTGLKGALAGLMSGGWLGLLLGLLFRRRIAPMLAALESLFAQWQAGTLPLPATRCPAPAAATLVAVPAPAHAVPRARSTRRRRASASRRRPVASAATPRAVAPRGHGFLLPPLHPSKGPVRHHIARNTKKDDARSAPLHAHIITISK